MAEKKIMMTRILTLLCILFAGSNALWADKYQKITSTDDLVVGEKYIIVCESKSKAMGAVNTYGAAEGVTITDNTIDSKSSLNILTLDGETDAWTFYTSKESKFLLWSSGNSLSAATPGISNAWKWKISFSNGNAVIANKVTNERKLVYNASSPRFACYTSSQTAVQLYKLIAETPKVTDAGWATFVPQHDVTFAEGVAFVAKVAGNTVQLTDVNAVKAGTPVLLKGEGSKVATITDITPDDVENDLLVSDGTIAGDEATIYVLANKNDKVGFYLLASSVTVPEGKAYLSVASGGAHEFLGFGDATRISNLNANPNLNANYYDLQGRRIAKPIQGVYIKDGRKVIIK